MFMNKLRKQTKYFLWVVVFGFVMWIAFDLGANLVLKKNKPWQKGIIAEIDGREIPYKIFELRYTKALQDTLKNNKNRQLSYEEEQKIKESVWKEMLSVLRYSDLLKKRRIKFNDDVYLSLMQSIPPIELLQDSTFLDSTGRFDYRKYRQAMGDPRNAGFFINYEYRLRSEILPRELNVMDIYYAIDMTDAEMNNLMVLEMEKRKVKYFLIKPFDIPDSLIHYSEDEIRSYYEAHQEEFRVPNTYKLLVVRFPLRPSSGDTLDAKERLNDVLFSISQGDTFELLAKEMSDDPSKSDGGDIGWIRESGKYDFIFKVLKKAPIDTVIGPFIYDDAWYLAKKIGEDADSMHVKIIRSDIKVQEQTVYDLQNEASNFVEAVKSEDFREFAKEQGYELIETGYFKENAAFARGIGMLKGRIKELIKKSKKGEVVGPVKVGSAFIVFKVEDIKKSYIPSYDSIKVVVEKQFKWQSKLEKAKELAEKARDVVKINPDSSFYWDSAKVIVEPARATVTETKPFALSSLVDYNVGKNVKFKSVVFALREKELSNVHTDERIGAFFVYLESIIKNENLYPFVVNMRKSKLFENLLGVALMSEIAGTVNVKDYREHFIAN